MTNLNMCVQAHHFSIMVGSEEFLIPWHDNDVDHDTHNCFTSCNSQVGSCASCDLDGQQGYCCPHTNDVLQKPNFCSAGDMSSKLFSAVSQHYNNPDHFNHHMLAGIIPPGSTKLEHTCVVAPKSPCYPNPCLNSGECAVSGDKAVCTCKTGFSGDLCATTPCSATPCKNSGVCSVSVAGDGSGTFACDCTGTGFTGATCEDTSPCASDPCKNGGTCKDASNALGYECSCLSGFGGDQCQNDPCSTNPCNNGGTCAVVMVSKDNASVGTAVCTCKGVFIGPTCDNKPCDSNPCQNGGTCTDVDGGTFTCACKNGYSGNTCTESVCDSKPCKYEGTCSVNDAVSPYYACTCKSGYSGPTCETTPCSTDPCQNGGTCKLANNANGYTCSCPDGIFGDKCQINCNAVSIVTLDCQTDFVISLTVDMNCFGFYYPGSDVKDIKITAAASNEVTVGNTCTSFATGESGNNHIYRQVPFLYAPI